MTYLQINLLTKHSSTLVPFSSTLVQLTTKHSATLVYFSFSAGESVRQIECFFLHSLKPAKLHMECGTTVPVCSLLACRLSDQ